MRPSARRVQSDDVANYPVLRFLQAAGRQSSVKSSGQISSAQPQHEKARPGNRFVYRARSTPEDDIQRFDEQPEGSYKREDGRIGVRHQLRALLWSWPNLLLLFVPAGFAVNYAHQGPVTTFAVNFIAIFPLVGLSSYATEELDLRVGAGLGELINVTLSNTAQLITSILLLRDNQIALLQTTLIGNVLSNMHLMLGISYLFGGYNRPEQHYNLTVAHVSANLLLLSMVGLILPTMGKQLSGITDSHMLKISRGIAFVFLFAYVVYTFFSLRTHVSIYIAPSEKVMKQNLVRRNTETDNVVRAVAGAGATAAASAGGQITSEPLPQGSIEPSYEEDEEEEEKKLPNVSLPTSVICLVLCTTLIAFNTLFATNSLDGLFQQTGISRTFVGIVLLPLLSNDATVIVPAVKDAMDQVLLLTVGKCLQTILVVTPLLILLGWIMGKDMNLSFDPFEVVALFASVLYINSIISIGKSTYLDGIMLLSVFLIICLVSFWVP